MTDPNEVAKLVERLRNNRIEYLTTVGDHQHEPCELCLEAADALSRIAAERDEARLLVTEANNSLYGSQGYFHSLNGGPFDKYHLASGIEKAKAYGREQWRKAEAAERERDELKAEVKRLREALGLQNEWVRAALECKDWVWDGDQREAAEWSLSQARAALRTEEVTQTDLT